MTSPDRQPATNNFYDTESEAILGAVASEWESMHLDDFKEMDAIILEREKITASKESEVILHLQDSIKSVGALQKMLVSVGEFDDKEYPTCDHVLKDLNSMENDLDDKGTALHINSLNHLRFLTRLTQEFAGTAPQPMFETKGHLVIGITEADGFTYKEKTALAQAANIFLSSEE